jgi:hypothetical protein
MFFWGFCGHGRYAVVGSGVRRNERRNRAVAAVYGGDWVEEGLDIWYFESESRVAEVR